MITDMKQAFALSGQYVEYMKS